MRQSELTDYQSAGVQCPTCKKPCKSEAGVKIHHAKAHGESIAGVEVTCDWCGERTRQPQSQVNDSERDFCNLECHGEWLSENEVGEDSRSYKSVAVECAWCGTEKRVPPSRDRENEHHYCDRECWRQWRSENITGEDSWRWSRVETECGHCGTPIAATRSRFEANDWVFCDGDCYAEWQSENRYGEAHPQYQGGAVTYGPGWSESKREAVRERQGRECAGCGLSEAENGFRLDVHHITKAREFEDPSSRNAEDNLVALCKQCHPEWEKMSPLRPVVE